MNRIAAIQILGWISLAGFWFPGATAIAAGIVRQSLGDVAIVGVPAEPAEFFAKFGLDMLNN